MITHDQNDRKAGAGEDVVVSDRLLETARLHGHDPQRLVDEINRAARELAASGPRGPKVALSTTCALLLWLVLQTALLLAALVVFWSGDTLGVNGERHLFLLVLLAGTMGSSVAMLMELVESVSDHGVYARDLALLLALPVVGAGVSLIFYSVIRGGLLATSTADGKTADFINPFGAVGIAALVGLFLRGALGRLSIVSTTLFGGESESRPERNR
jgi:hypothetical protein